MSEPETFVVLIAEDQHGCLKTALVRKESFDEDPDPASYFDASMTCKEVSGHIEISGDTNLLPDWITEG